MAEVKKRWYVIRAISGKEKRVKEMLELEITRNKLENYIEQVLIPTEKVYQIRNGKKVSKEKNYFPGYVLIFEHFRIFFESERSLRERRFSNIFAVFSTQNVQKSNHVHEMH